MESFSSTVKSELFSDPWRSGTKTDRFFEISMIHVIAGASVGEV